MKHTDLTDRQKMSKKMSIGRDKSCDIHIDNNYNDVSRNHATLYIDGSRMMLEDHSYNGTRVNGRIINNSQTLVFQGDEILFGKSARLSWSEVSRFSSQGSGSKSAITIFSVIGSVIVIIVVVSLIKNSTNNSSYIPTSAPLLDDGSKKATNCDCRIFTASGFTWDGDCSEGYANGNGRISWNSGKIYDGEVVRGDITGTGKEYLYSDLVYEGEFREGKKEGIGILYKNGSRSYSGAFSNDSPNGYGTLYFDNSSIIKRKGFFRNGMFRYEEQAIDKCDKVGREVVQEIFDGGINIQTILYSIKMDERERNVELTFDLTFNGNINTSNFYSCRVIARSDRTPYIEFVESHSNENVRTWIDIHNFIGIISGIANILEQWD